MMAKDFVGPNIVQGSGGKSGGGSGRSPVESPNTLQSKAIARFIDLLGEGQNGGLVDGAKSIYLNGTALQNSDLSYNFEGISWEERVGTIDQLSIDGIPTSASEVSVGVNVTNVGGAVIRTVLDTSLAAVRVRLQLASLYQVLNDGSSNAGDIVENSVTFRIEYKAIGGAWVVHTGADITITGKTTSPYEMAYRVPLTGAGTWDLRVTRISPDDDAVTKYSLLSWSAYTELVDEKFSYPYCHILGVKVDTALFGTGAPARSYHIKGRLVEIPSNYNPATRAYTGIWDGTFLTAWTDNPAWCYRDLLRNNRFGLGRVIKAMYIDDAQLYVIAQRCDTIVSDGYGGTEPQFTCNLVLTTQNDAYQVVNDFASVFRGMTFWSAGFLTLMQDAASSRELLATEANVKDGIFNRSSTSLKARHNAVLVSYNDPTNMFKPAVEITQDNASIAINGYRPKRVTAFGCSSRGQAKRAANWLMYTEQMETQTIVYTAGGDHAWAVPGTIVGVSDPAQDETRQGGRVVTYTSNVVTLDAALAGTPIAANLTFHYLDANGLEQSLAVVSYAGAVFTLASALPTDLASNTIWAISDSSAASIEDFRILKNTPTGDGGYEILAVSYNADKYAQIINGLNFDAMPSSTVNTGAILPPLNLNIQFYAMTNYGASSRVGAVFAWTRPNDSRVESSEVQYRKDGGSWQDAATENRAVSADIETLKESRGYYFRVRARSADGRYSLWVTTALVTAIGRTAIANSITSLVATSGVKQVTLTWVAPTEISVKEYSVYRGVSGTFSTAAKIGSTNDSPYVDTSGTVGTTYYYWVVTVLYDPSASNALAGAYVTGSPTNVTATDIAPGAVGSTQLASAINTIDIVATLPVVGTQGRVVFLTSDNKLYRDTGTVWTKAVPTADLTGTISNAQIAALAVTANELAANSVIAGKIAVGAVSATEISVTSLSAISATLGTFTSGATSTDRVVIKDDVIQVIDAANVVRVKLGNLI